MVPPRAKSSQERARRAIGERGRASPAERCIVNAQDCPDGNSPRLRGGPSGRVWGFACGRRRARGTGTERLLWDFFWGYESLATSYFWSVVPVAKPVRALAFGSVASSIVIGHGLGFYRFPSNVDQAVPVLRASFGFLALLVGAVRDFLGVASLATTVWIVGWIGVWVKGVRVIFWGGCGKVWRSC